MSSISEYQSLEENGSMVDRRKFIVSLTNRNEIEEYLRKSSIDSHDRLQMWIFLLNIKKNHEQLLEIFRNEEFPIEERILAGRYWIKLQKDPEIVLHFLIEIFNKKIYPRYLKSRLLKILKQYSFLRKSSSFFFDLSIRLSETINYEEYNLGGNLLPYCSQDQIKNLLSHWSIKSFKQIDRYSPIVLRLCEHQPSIILDLIKEDLQQFNQIDEKYFNEKFNLFELIFRKQTKELIDLFIYYLNSIENHQRFIPSIVSKYQKYFFRKCPNEMIEFISIVATNEKGSLKCQSDWGGITNLSTFIFPRSFSEENFIRLFSLLYDKHQWNENHFISLLHLMFNDRNVSLHRKERRWFFENIIQQQIGFEIFLEKLFKQANEQTLLLLDQYPELTHELSIYLSKKFERENGFLRPEQRLSFLRYQRMTNELYEQFLCLFKQTGSNVNQRQLNYPLFIQSAISTNDQILTQNVLRFIEKRFTNEQLIVIESFIQKLSSFHRHFHLEILPNNLQTIENIFHLAFNHLQRTSTTLSSIVSYAIFLLRLVESKPNQSIENFAIQLIETSYEKDDTLYCRLSDLSNSFPRIRNILLEIFIEKIFPKNLSKCRLDHINRILSSFANRRKFSLKIDLFLDEFFRKLLPSSKKIQSTFQLEDHSMMIEFYLQNPSTRLQRIDFLINQINPIFVINENIQRILVCSQQFRSFIDQFINDDKFLDEDSSRISIQSNKNEMKRPGLDFHVLNTSIRFLTRKQQQHITNLIINDFIPNTEVKNLDKLKSLRVLRRLTNTYEQILPWIEEKQRTFVEINREKVSGRANRGATGQSIDDFILCLPATMDLKSEFYLEQFQILKEKINAGNAKYISDALWNISRRIQQEIFLENYFQLIENENFLQLGITANKEFLRLLIHYSSSSGLIKNFIEPFWNRQIHQDLRAILILILLNFLDKSHSNEEENLLWNILHQASTDEYSLVIQYLFGLSSNFSTRILSKLKNSFPQIFEKYVNEIQLKVLDHPMSLEIRSIAWRSIDEEFVQMDLFIEKGKDLCLQFNQQSNHLWELAFKKLISLFKLSKILSVEKLIEIIEQLMLLRDEIDTKYNGIDNLHDLPVYHRIQRLLINLHSQLDRFPPNKIEEFRRIFEKLILFDRTLASMIGNLFIRISKTKEQLEEFFLFLEKHLPENYFQTLLSQFGTIFIKENSSAFIQQMNLEEKIEFVRWFIEKNRSLFIWDYLREQIFNQTNLDRSIAIQLIQQIRSTDHLFLRQQAMEYLVPWNENKN